jgi:2-polyprenyl-3-methyl-5-hydroxy-6-metoxy-1,4-benzoquinol methylase
MVLASCRGAGRLPVMLFEKRASPAAPAAEPGPPAPGRAELLELINRDIPKGVDWKAGAERYVASSFEKLGRERVEQYSLNKPISYSLSPDPTQFIRETAHYLNNFTNVLSLLKPETGARVLDVACGGGWMSHYLARMGYGTLGIDICQDFIDLAAQRLASDPFLNLTPDEATDRFLVLDIEQTGLPSHLQGSFDYIWLESCLHHFVDPITALEHLSEALKPDGVIILMEFENRTGPIKPEYLQVMQEFDTLERPYSRSELLAVLDMAGLKDVEFFGAVNGWFSPKDSIMATLGEAVRAGAKETNLALCAKQPGRLDPLFPHGRTVSPWSFGRGVYPNVNGYRWCEPVAVLEAETAIPNAGVTLHSIMPARTGRSQSIVAYSAKAEIGRLELDPGRLNGVLTFGDLAEGDQVTLVSTEAFRPSWDGGDDPRLLSFYLETAF